MRVLLIFALFFMAVFGIFKFFEISNRETIKNGPFTANGKCPRFQSFYSKCEIIFGNKGLSVLNSAYETFLGEGAFEIYSFNVKQTEKDRFTIIAESNRGELISDIYTDRVVRIGQDKEDEILKLTHQSAYCHDNRIYEHQTVYNQNKISVIQRLEYWTENDIFHFQLFQGDSKTAKVECRI